MENLELKLKGIASYKSCELLEMMIKLKLNDGCDGLKDTDKKKKKKTKKEMYEEIELYLRN